MCVCNGDCWPHFRLVSFALQPDYGFSIYTLPETVRFGQVRPQAPRPKDLLGPNQPFPAWLSARFDGRSAKPGRHFHPLNSLEEKRRQSAPCCVQQPAAYRLTGFFCLKMAAPWMGPRELSSRVSCSTTAQPATSLRFSSEAGISIFNGLPSHMLIVSISLTVLR